MESSILIDGCTHSRGQRAKSIGAKYEIESVLHQINDCLSGKTISLGLIAPISNWVTVATMFERVSLLQIDESPTSHGSSD